MRKETWRGNYPAVTPDETLGQVSLSRNGPPALAVYGDGLALSVTVN